MFLIWSFESVAGPSFLPVTDTNDRAGTDFGATSSFIVTLVGFFPLVLTVLAVVDVGSFFVVPSGLVITALGADGFPDCCLTGVVVVLEGCFPATVVAEDGPRLPWADRLKTSWPELVFNLCSG